MHFLFREFVGIDHGQMIKGDAPVSAVGHVIRYDYHSKQIVKAAPNYGILFLQNNERPVDGSAHILWQLPGHSLPKYNNHVMKQLAKPIVCQMSNILRHALCKNNFIISIFI